MPLHLLTAYLI
jgi:hypothetical protein